MNKLRILFVCENYIPHYGGAEVVFKNLAEGLVKRGHKVDLITHRIKGTKTFEILNGVRVHRVRCLDSRYLFTFFSVPKVLKLTKKADIIQTTTFNGAFPAWLAAQIRKKPVVLTVHEVWIGKWRKVTDMNFLKALMHDLLERTIYLLKYDKYICVSRATQNDLLRINISQPKTDVIYNGIDYKQWNPNKYDGNEIRKKLKLEKDFIYMFTGRPGPSKGLEYLIQAVPLIAQKIKNAKLIAIVSKDKQYKQRFKNIIEIIKRLRVQDQVIMIKPLPYKDLPNYIKAADCFVIPSLAEGFGFTTVEACAMRKPVVATRAGAIPEVISGRYLLVKPKNSKEIANAIEKVFKKQTRKSKLKKFTISENIERYLNIYRSLKE